MLGTRHSFKRCDWFIEKKALRDNGHTMNSEINGHNQNLVSSKILCICLRLFTILVINLFDVNREKCLSSNNADVHPITYTNNSGEAHFVHEGPFVSLQGVDIQ